MDLLLHEIKELLAAPRPANTQTFLERLDATLTAGYAQALQLEAERWRLERRIGEVASTLAETGSELDTAELSTLGRRLASANEEISMLRALLGALREHRSTVHQAA